MPKPPAEYDHHYLKVPRLGTVILSPEAMAHLEQDGVTAPEIEKVLTKGTDRKGGTNWGWRSFDDIRLVLRTRPHMKGAAVVCIDGYRVKP